MAALSRWSCSIRYMRMFPSDSDDGTLIVSMQKRGLLNCKPCYNVHQSSQYSQWSCRSGRSRSSDTDRWHLHDADPIHGHICHIHCIRRRVEGSGPCIGNPRGCRQSMPLPVNAPSSPTTRQPSKPFEFRWIPAHFGVPGNS